MNYATKSNDWRFYALAGTFIYSPLILYSLNRAVNAPFLILNLRVPASFAYFRKVPEMPERPNQSQIALFREQQAQQEKAAHAGLYSPAITARHDFIEARAERGARRILHLIAQGRYEEAEVHLNLPDRGLAEEEG